MSLATPLIHRREEDYKRHGQVSTRICRNLHPNYHPFHKAKEYTRALNATKLERLFAKPFVAALPGSKDGIWKLAAVPRHASLLAAGDCEGELRLWNAALKTVEWQATAHSGFVHGLSADGTGEALATCGADRCVKVWSLHNAELHRKGKRVEPRFSAAWESALMDVDFQRTAEVFATAGEGVQLWDVNRKEPKWRFEWGSSTCTSVKFSPIEPNMLLCASNDRGVALYDARVKSPTKKIVMNMAINSICWNPMETFDFTLASEDTNLYTFDVRKLHTAKTVHKDHLNAVMSVSYSPTGQEFVSGSYDKTIRIFGKNGFRSREVYHAKRMQRVFSVCYSLDGRFVFSGSDDTNIRVWKANAAEKLGVISNKEKEYLDYSEKLKQKYQFMPEIKKIAKYRHIPKPLFNAKKKRQIMETAKKRKEQRHELHTKKKAAKKPVKSAAVVGVIE